MENGRDQEIKTMEEREGVNNLTSYRIDEERLLVLAEKIVKEEKKEGRIGFALIGKDEIKELNRTYRGKDRTTDVLYFFYGEEDFLGEVILCPEKIEEDAEGKDFTREFFRVAIHGILHILGYDHEKSKEEEEEMQMKTDSLLDKLQKKQI